MLLIILKIYQTFWPKTDSKDCDFWSLAVKNCWRLGLNLAEIETQAWSLIIKLLISSYAKHACFINTFMDNIANKMSPNKKNNFWWLRILLVDSHVEIMRQQKFNYVRRLDKQLLLLWTLWKNFLWQQNCKGLKIGQFP